MSTPVMIPMISPDGRSGDIPNDRAAEAVQAGFKRAITMTSPDGQAGYIPIDRVKDAEAAGFKQGSPSEVAITNQPKQGFMSALGSDLGGMAKGAAPMLLGAPGIAYQGAKQSLADYQSLKMTGKTQAQRAYEDRVASGRSPAYAVAAGANEAIGVNAKGMEQAADSGDVSGVLGHAAAVPTVMAATAGAARAVPATVNALKPVAGSTAESLYRSALKPSTTIPVEKASRIVSTALDNRIPISPEGIDKLNTLQTNLNNAIANTIASDPSAFISKSKVAQRLSDTYQNAVQQVNPTPDIKRINTVREDFMKSNPANIPADRAQAIKQGTYQSIKSANYGDLKASQVEAQKALARGIKEELEVQFPEIKKLNNAEGRLLELEPVLEKAVNRIGNHQMVGIGTPLASTAGAAVGGTGGAAAAGMLKFVLDNPAVKSKLAFALNSVSKGKMGLPGAHARVAAYAASLGSAASSEGANDNQSSQ